MLGQESDLFPQENHWFAAILGSIIFSPNFGEGRVINSNSAVNFEAISYSVIYFGDFKGCIIIFFSEDILGYFFSELSSLGFLN